MKKQLFLLAAIVVAAWTTSCSPNRSNEPAGYLTASLDPEAWNSSVWISAPDAPVVTEKITGKSLAADGASLFVGKLQNGDKVVSARWMTTGLGIYSLYVNGQPVGEEVLKPGFTHPMKTRRAFTYDITDVFRKGRGDINILAAQVTPGWWADKIVTPGGHEGMLGKKPAFRAVLEILYNDGTGQWFGTDTLAWKAGVGGPVKHASIFDGERYDAREPLQPAFAALSLKPEVNTEFSGEILPTDGAEVYLRKDLALAPVKAYVWKEVEGAEEEAFGKVVIAREYAPDAPMTLDAGETLVVDFGQNCAAVPEFLFQAAEGTVLTCLPSEILNDGNGAKSRGMDGPEGSCHRTNLRTPENCMRIDYTFAASAEPVSYRPSCSFFGYRYVSITTTAPVTIVRLRSVPVTSIAEELETGRIETGDESINRLISNAIWGERSNYLSVPTDCPQRNERLGWTADTQVFTETGSFFANTDLFFHKWMRDMRDTQSEVGGFPGVAPFGQYGAEPSSMMRVGWADAGIIVPWTVWKQFGDTTIIDENWDAMDRFITHIDETKYDHRTLSEENGDYQWADWLSYEPLESCGGDAFIPVPNGKRLRKPEAITYWNYLCASYWVIDAGMMRDMAAATGRDAARFEEMTARAKAYVREQFLNPDGTFKLAILNTMQTPALFALKNQLFDGAAKEAIVARLRANFAAHDNCLQTGFLGTSILMDTLTENGMVDIAYALLFQRKNPSWLYSVDNGATTIWERWNSYMIESGMGPKGMNSFNHYAYGCVCAWIWKTVAGIAADPADPGFAHIIMKPVPDKRLGFVKAEYDSAFGTIRSEWKYDGDDWVWSFTLPEGTTASVTLPGETEAKEYTEGTYEVRQNG